MTTRWLLALGFVFTSLASPAHAGDVSSRKIDAANQSVFPREVDKFTTVNR